VTFAPVSHDAGLRLEIDPAAEPPALLPVDGIAKECQPGPISAGIWR